MENFVSVLISNNTGISDSSLYVFVTDGNNNFYLLNAANNYQATAQSAACSILLSDLPTSSAGVYEFYISSALNITGGRVWFTTSSTALTQGTKGIVQPTALADYVFDFVELALTAPTTTPAGATISGNANIDTTQVDALGIPITVYINPVENGNTFPPPTTVDVSTLNYPNVIGIAPWQALNEIISGFTTGIKGTVYEPFNACAWSGTGGVQRLVAPFHLIDNYSSGTAPSTLATFLDTAIYNFFKYYTGGKTLTLQDPVSLNQYSGTVTTITEKDTAGNNVAYNVFQFTCGSEKLNIYYPYFNTNCSAFPGVLDSSVTLQAPPSWWTGNLPTTMPATAMVLACAGAFSDAKYQTGVTNETLLANLENQLVSLISRGLTPVTDNLISFNAQYSAADIQYNQVSITNLPANTIIETGMYMVKQVAAQPLTVVSAATVGNTTAQIIITNPVGPVLAIPSCLFLCGRFYNPTTNAAGYSNMYANYLHYGNTASPAPLLNNIGYGFAFDDQGGYSNDVTANYNSDNSLTVGVFLGPLKLSIA